MAQAVGGLPWESLLLWAGLFLVLYALHDVFPVVFLTFLLTYLVRAIVVPLARRISPDLERPWLERWLALGTFVGIAAILWGLATLMGPQFVLQGRLLVAHAERREPEEVLDHVLARTAGAYLFRQTYGGPEDPRYQSALQAFVAQGQVGEGAYASFAHALARVQAGFEIAYEGAARARLSHQLKPDGSLAMALYALLGIGVIHAIESMILSPRIVGKFLHLHPVLVLAVLVVGEHLFGIWGLLLGVPVAVFAIHAGILAESIPGVYEPGQGAGQGPGPAPGGEVDRGRSRPELSTAATDQP